MMDCGAVLVVYGEQAETSARRALEALAAVCPSLPVTVHRERADGLTDSQCSRWAKVTLLDWTPYRYSAYLDADTQVYEDIRAGFDVLRDGWDLALAPSQHQGQQSLWHVAEPERRETLAALPIDSLQLQAGVMFVARNERTAALWAAWHEEWRRWQGQDQAALLRALHRTPVKIWMLGQPWNNGALIGHHFGAIRRTS